MLYTCPKEYKNGGNKGNNTDNATRPADNNDCTEISN